MKKKKPVFEGKIKLKKGDEVMVLTGKDKGKQGKILQALPDEGKVIVEGVNIVTRHQKPRSTGSRAMVKGQLGEMKMPMGLSINKVMLICQKCHKETRIARGVGADGKMTRKCQKCGEMIDA